MLTCPQTVGEVGVACPHYVTVLKKKQKNPPHIYVFATWAIHVYARTHAHNVLATN